MWRCLSASLLALTLLCISPLTQAEVRWYFSTKTALAEHQLSDSDHGGSIGNGQIVSGELDGTLAATYQEDPTASAGIAIARQSANWLIEGELAWRYRTDWDLRARTHSLNAVTNTFANIATTTLMANLLRHGQLTDRWGWQLGAGVGLAYIDISSELVERADNGRREQTSYDSVEPAWSVMAGLRRDIGRAWALNFRYRYIDLGAVETGRFPLSGATVQANHAAHELQFSLERRLRPEM